MVFSSTLFILFFLPIALGLYYLVPKHCVSLRNAALTAASLLFYLWGEALNIFLLLAILFVSYGVARIMHKLGNPKIWLAVGIILNLSNLFFYKYLGWFAEMFDAKLFTGTALPLGISFFTFHAISYLIDVYRRDIQPSRNILDFTTYFVMFPHLVAGPIVRFAHVMDDLRQKRGSFDLFYSGVARFVIGLGKKTLIANQVAIVADATFALPADTLGTGAAWLGALAYTLQIYFDFSAYSDMAIGLAAMFGFRFHENFNHPYGASSMQDFWKKWHISLSSWLRDYLYIPLGGNRNGKTRTYINLLLVFFICGLWHGANWTFILWGVYHGLFLVLERFGLARWIDSKSRLLTRLYVVLAFIVGWVIFRADTLTHAGGYLWEMFSFHIKEIPVQIDYKTSTRFWIALAVGAFASSGIPWNLWHRLSDYCKSNLAKSGVELANLLYGAAIMTLSIMTLLSGSHNPFLYFRF
jgi:alginate O-acetyltransferase complex protein AlgI